MLHHIESGTGPAVILLHAFPMDSALWAAQRRALASAGYRVITVDLPGFGGSALSTEPPSLDDMADRVAELMDQLDLADAVVGGLSMGGYVVMAMLRRHPGRLRGIVLADTKASADPPEAAANRLRVADEVESSGSSSALAEGMLPNLLGATTRESRPDVVDAVRRWIGAQPASGVAWAQRAMAARPDSTADLAAFGRPVLVVVGEQDTISPMADAQAIAAAARAGGARVTVVEIPEAGHLTAVEDPQAVTHALQAWLPSVLGEG
jgi:pimeloyl-ACP methyl ester carboxylesterase